MENPHGKIEVALGNMEIQAFAYEGHADHEQKTESQHFYGWMPVNAKTRYWFLKFYDLKYTIRCINIIA